MTCKSCTSDNQQRFSSEINIHFPGLQNLDKPTVFVFPKVLVCMDCGFTEFAVPETELRLLGQVLTTPGTKTAWKKDPGADLSDFVAGLPYGSSEIETCECAADKPLAVKYGFYRH